MVHSIESRRLSTSEKLGVVKAPSMQLTIYFVVTVTTIPKRAELQHLHDQCSGEGSDVIIGSNGKNYRMY